MYVVPYASYLPGSYGLPVSHKLMMRVQVQKQGDMNRTGLRLAGDGWIPVLPSI